MGDYTDPVNAGVLNTVSDSSYFVSKKDILKIKAKGNKNDQKYGFSMRYMLDKLALLETENSV